MSCKSLPGECFEDCLKYSKNRAFELLTLIECGTNILTVKHLDGEMIMRIKNATMRPINNVVVSDRDKMLVHYAKRERILRS